MEVLFSIIAVVGLFAFCFYVGYLMAIIRLTKNE